jgi:hypothetical protein
VTDLEQLFRTVGNGFCRFSPSEKSVMEVLVPGYYSRLLCLGVQGTILVAAVGLYPWGKASPLMALVVLADTWLLGATLRALWNWGRYL